MTTITGRTPGVDHFSGAQLLRTLQLFARDPELEELIDQHGDRRLRRELVATPYLQVWLISWPAGSTTGWHDHRGATGAHLLVRGELTERSWFGGVHEEPLVSDSGRAPWRQGRSAPSSPPAVAAGPAGREFGSAHVHEIANLGERPALSLHASAPARGVTRYTLRDGRLEPVATVSPR